MAEERKVPKLRFKGFTDDWKQRKINDVSEFKTGGGTPTTNNLSYWSGNIPWIQSSSIEENNLFTVHLEKAITEEAIEKSSAKKIPKNSIAVVTRVGLGKLCLIDKEYASSQDFLNFSSLNGDPYFLTFAMHRVLNQIKNRSQGTSIKGITKQELLQTKINLPYNRDEQYIIGGFLLKIDNLITLEQEKCKNLIQTKDWLLHKMFTDERSPEIRFCDFSEPWKQRILGDISEKVTQKNTNLSVTETFTNSATKGIISQSDYFDKNISNEKNIDKYYIVSNDDFVYNPRISNSAPVGPIKRNKLKRIGIMSPLYYVFRISNQNINNSFLEQYFNSFKWHRFMYSNGNTGARSDRFSISDKQFEKMPIMIPDQKEQQKIAQMLDEIEYLIALEHGYIKMLNKIRSQLLNLMLV
ncbi:restriction endonuclease subunit S [Aerococcaceae bacterium DSM 111020]|nr:restriction endonuclease subunit S [Aerococcaceae bacterium DSM 111020]